MYVCVYACCGLYVGSGTEDEDEDLEAEYVEAAYAENSDNDTDSSGAEYVVDAYGIPRRLVTRAQTRPGTTDGGGGGCTVSAYVTTVCTRRTDATASGEGLPRASHSNKIALTGLRRLHPALAAALVLFAHSFVTTTAFSCVVRSPFS
jgi:hypothetical protein